MKIQRLEEPNSTIYDFQIDPIRLALALQRSDDAAPLTDLLVRRQTIRRDWKRIMGRETSKVRTWLAESLVRFRSLVPGAVGERVGADRANLLRHEMSARHGRQGEELRGKFDGCFDVLRPIGIGNGRG